VTGDMCPECGSNIQGQDALTVGGAPAPHRCSTYPYHHVYSGKFYVCGEDFCEECGCCLGCWLTECTRTHCACRVDNR
jgi:hypothetical protein